MSTITQACRRHSPIRIAFLIAAGCANGSLAWAAEGDTNYDLQGAVQDIRTQAAGTGSSGQPAPSDGQLLGSASAERSDLLPPPGASHHVPAIAVETLESKSARRKAGAAKPLPALTPGLPSARTATTTLAIDRGLLQFSSGSIRPAAGLDPRVAARTSAATAKALRAAGQTATYGFVLLSEQLGKEIESDLAALGITLLGAHGEAQKARLPLDENNLRTAAALPYVDWISNSTPTLKTATELANHVAAGISETTELPIIINLFETDPQGNFRAQLEAAGAIVGRYDAALMSYRAVATRTVLDAIVELDFVLFVELEQPHSTLHSESMAVIGMDYIRPGSYSTSYDGTGISLGIMDSGFMLGAGAAVPHVDLNKNGCGNNYTTDVAGVWNDQNTHGTHVLTTISGTGTGDSRYKGVAPALGATTANRIRAAKVFKSDNTGYMSWTESAMDFMALATDGCGGTRPLVINYSGGSSGTNLVGTDSTSRKLDDLAYTNRQLFVISAGNDGPGAGTVGSPGVAKNALTIGNVYDYGYLQLGTMRASSSRGPTGDLRLKPNVSAPGTWIMSASAGTTSGYKEMAGTSMAAPHVTGLAATLMQHYSWLQWNPARMRAYLMATTLQYGDSTAANYNYGLGRVSAYKSHWGNSSASGWSTYSTTGTVSSSAFLQTDVTVPAGARRLVAVMTWDEPAASAGAAKAVVNDLDLWVDVNADCAGTLGACGEYTSDSSVDNTEYVVIENPVAGTYRIKATPYSATAAGLPTSIAVTVIRGDTTPATSLFATTSTRNPTVGGSFSVTTTVTNPSYIASGVQLGNTWLPSGVTLQSVATTRKDGIPMSFGTATELGLGDIVAGDSRSATWTFQLTSSGYKTLSFRSWSDNGGESTINVTLPVRFNDVSPTSWAVSYINALYDNAITTGCGSGNYCPTQNVTREQMAAFIVRAREGNPVAGYCGTTPPFADVPVSNAFCGHIKRLKELNITTGCGGGYFCPSQNVDRQQMAAFIVRAAEGEPSLTYCSSGSGFADVLTSNSMCRYIKRLAELGVTTGCGGGNYCPTQNVTREQMAAFLARAFLGM